MYSVDKRHEAAVASHSWCDNGNGYLVSRMNTKLVYLHHYVYQLEHGFRPKVDKYLTMDHINRDPSDNRLCNLRIVNRATQTFNTKDRPRSQDLPRGVVCVKDRKRKYRAYIGVDGKNKWLGSFHTIEEANEARLTAVKERMEQCNQQS